jgi:hypothetical protein
VKLPRAIWFKVGRQGEAYPEIVRDLDGYSGAYVIRVAKRVRYVGESHTGRLRKTLVRHFQEWKRSSGRTFWERRYGRQNDPGTTYERARAEVAVFLSNASDALDLEAELIRRYRPIDNVNLAAILQDVPF